MSKFATRTMRFVPVMAAALVVLSKIGEGVGRKW